VGCWGEDFEHGVRWWRAGGAVWCGESTWGWGGVFRVGGGVVEWMR
jgi:hypothetical protein